ncbi:LuxR C-terminal-related transcriptional regulator [Streptomyces rhizosphaerihabitans]|uniref:LuxR C-terminal-related transcriptional regulator n=1 Tax=Streptomyces rhizosphaerihabitans TaxID=1266770 RepID=UPI0021C03D32|nr:LuxR C-terminal-related transcriptional regulator [Streptomyces rhizosphaerihabitans]MCT9008943.1 LuxR C-terminal-related transcriptional regulator [Streptomyces rhizosphaerihabitans]
MAGLLTPGGDPLLAVRFTVPDLTETFVRRPRLVGRLTEGVQGPLTLVNGPAGAGKTLLVAHWISTMDRPGDVAWLTVEHEDTGPGIFWTYVLESLRRHGAAVPDDIGSPSSPGDVDHSLLTRLAAWLSERADPVILVLDEFDRVGASAEVADELQFVLRHAGGGLRLVIVSRTEPQLPLHRYRAAGAVAEVRGADLAFVPGETATLLSRHDIRLSDDGARSLTEWTGGWAAGLRLCILAAQHVDDPDTFIKNFEAGQSTLADFLLAEVLEAQSDETQDLLLRSSILEQIHPDLANALTGRDDAEPILAGLQHANAFVEAIGHSWYRLHPLFAEILRVHLRVRHPGMEPELRRRAARWLSDAGLLAEALPHAAGAGEWELAADRFVDELAIGQLLTGLDAERLDGLFAAMPPDAAGPAACLVRAARELVRHDVDRGLDFLRRAGENLTDEGAGTAALRLSHALLRVFAARLTGSAERAEAAAEDMKAAELFLPAERLEQHPELWALMLTDLGSAQLWAGRFDAARTSLSGVAQLDDGPSTAYPRHESLSRLALIDFVCGRPGRAETHARAAVAEAERSGLPPAARTGVAQLVLAAVAIDRDDLAAAQTHLDQATASTTASHDPVATAGLGLLRSRMLLAKGHPKEALRVLQELKRPPHGVEPSPWFSDRAALAMSTAHLALGDPLAALDVLAEERATGPEATAAAARARLATGDEQAARALLDGLPTELDDGPGIAVRVLLARAQTADALGDDSTAQRLVARALRLARPEHLRRPFVEAGPWLRSFVRRRPVLAQGHEWLPVMAAVRGTEPAPRPDQAPVIEALSDREKEVLERLAQMMSRDEIAADLHLSVNTVKTHLKSVYRKLAATRRGEAVRRARDLHLL